MDDLFKMELVKIRRAAFCCATALALGAGAFLAIRLRQLPRARLADGGEFRVVHIRYGTDHHLDGAPRPVRWLWQHLPLFVQARLPEPQKEVYGMSTETPSVSVWWTWIDPATGKPEVGPSDNAIMTLDSGERINLGWPHPSDDHRQILVFPPPLHSRFLKFHVVVNEERVDFTIKNPAFRESLPPTELSVFPMPVVQKNHETEPRDECVVVDFPDPIRAPKAGGDFEIEYRLSNQFSTELCLALDPTDHITSSFRDREWFTHKHEVASANPPHHVLRQLGAVNCVTASISSNRAHDAH